MQSTPFGLLAGLAFSVLLAQVLAGSEDQLSDLDGVGIDDDLALPPLPRNYMRTEQRRARPLRQAALAEAESEVLAGEELEDLGVVDDSDSDPQEVPHDLRQGPPGVARELMHMRGDLQAADDMHRQNEEAKDVERADAEIRAQKDLTMEGEAIKLEMKKTSAEEHRLERELDTFQGNDERLQNNRNTLLRRLHRAMDGKIRAREHHIHERELMTEKEQAALQALDADRHGTKARALKKLEERKKAQDSMIQAENTLAAAQKNFEMAKGLFQSKRMEVARVIQTYRGENEKYDAEVNKEKRAIEETKQEEHSLEEMREVLKTEIHKLDDPLEHGRHKLAKKKEADFQRLRNLMQNMDELKRRYAEWKDKEREQAKLAVVRREAIRKEQDTYERERKEMIDAGDQKATHAAEQESDWANNDDWAYQQQDFAPDPALAKYEMQALKPAAQQTVPPAAQQGVSSPVLTVAKAPENTTALSAAPSAPGVKLSQLVQAVTAEDQALVDDADESSTSTDDADLDSLAEDDGASDVPPLATGATDSVDDLE